MSKILVTGGAGFIGSSVIDTLMIGENEVTVVDNLSAGDPSNLEQWKGSLRFRFIKGDLLDPHLNILGDYDTVYHLAANPDVRLGSSSPSVHFSQNVLATYNLLEAIRKSPAEMFVFASTSTVYGEAQIIPTPESYGPLKPISVYGGSKLASEALVSSYASTYGFKAVILRLANIIGGRSSHGVIFDFVQKLRQNALELEILGDGTQSKSYLHVDDCVDAMIFAIKHFVEEDHQKVSILNVGSEDQISVIKIADIVCQESHLYDVRYKINPGTPDGRGWAGDVKLMRLDISKLKSMGWRPKMNSEEAVRRTVRELLQEKMRL